MAKKRMIDLVPILYRSCTDLERLKLKLLGLRSMVWRRRLDSAKADEKMIESAELWIYHRMLRVSWTEHRTVGLRRGHTIRGGGCELVKCVIQGKVSRKRRGGRPKASYSSNITEWMSESMERIMRETRDRAGWRRLVRCAALAADHNS